MSDLHRLSINPTPKPNRDPEPAAAPEPIQTPNPNQASYTHQVPYAQQPPPPQQSPYVQQPPYPQQPPPAAQPSYSQQAAYTPPQTTGMKTPILYGSVLALFGGIIYCVLQINQLKADLAETRTSIESEVGKVSESSVSTTKSHRASIEALKAELNETTKKSSQLVGQAKIEAERHADQIAADLKKAQDAQAAETKKVAESVTEVSTQVSAVKEDTNTNKQAVAAVNTEVANVKTQAEATNAELKKTIAELSSTKGDLGVQSGLIATNASQLKALKELGERNYTEFRVAKAKTSERVGDLQIRLTKTDAKKNRFTIEVVVDDKLVEKKDRTVNEPIQFLLPRATQPYELVVNEVRKDMIVGYLSAPKVQNARK